jgi:hypothetical protein
MSAEESDPSFFDDALRIHAICADAGLDENDARLLTYIHAKASESEQGIDYFNAPAEEDVDALEIMLGKSKKKIKIPPMVDLNNHEQEAVDMILSIAERISRLDILLAQECGMEKRLSGELSIRLRLYKDPVFKDKMITLYKNAILPCIDKYDPDKICLAFSKFQENRHKQEAEIMEMTGFQENNNTID